MSEHDHQVALFTAFRVNHRPEFDCIFAVPNGGLRNRNVAVKMKAEGAKAGVWDICVPVARDGFHGLFIEMKFGKNKLTEGQKKFKKLYEEQGYKTMIFYDWLEAYEAIIEYLDREQTPGRNTQNDSIN